MTSATDWTGASLRLSLSQGTIFQDPVGGNTASKPGLFASFPTLEYDTSVGGSVSAPLITGAPTDLGSNFFRFNTKMLNLAWSNTTKGDTGTFDIARITLSDDAVGTWSLFLTGEDRALRAVSGSIAAGTFNNTPPPSIPPQAVDGDFTGDGKADVFWHNKRTGRNAVWELNQGKRQSTIAVRSLQNTDWKLAGSGDFTGDGKNDLLWRNARDGRNAVWELDGTTFINNHLIRSLPNPEYWIAGVGDFTGDGKQDILWRRQSHRGSNSVWEMDGLVFQSNTPIIRMVGTEMLVAGVADLTGDGKDDIFWHNTRDQSNLVWKMDGMTRQSISPFKLTRRPVYQVAGFVDYQGDGIADISWRDTHRGWLFSTRLKRAEAVSSGGLFGRQSMNWVSSGSLGLWEDYVSFQP